MSLQKMLEYQKTDIAFYRREKELKESDERKRAMLCKNKFIECNSILKDISQQLSGYYKSLQKLEAKFAEVEELKKDLNDNIDAFETDEDFNAYEEKVAEYEKALAELNKELNKITKSISDASAQNRSVNDKMDALNREYLLSTQAYTKKKTIFEEQTKDIREKLENLSKDIEPAYLKRYMELRQNRKMPAFVPYMDKNCGACGMDISIEVDKKLQKSGDIAECPHCGRIVYKL